MAYLMHKRAQAVNPKHCNRETGQLSRRAQRKKQEDRSTSVGKEQTDDEIKPKLRRPQREEIIRRLSNSCAYVGYPACVCLGHLTREVQTARHLRSGLVLQ